MVIMPESARYCMKMLDGLCLYSHSILSSQALEMLSFTLLATVCVVIVYIHKAKSNIIIMYIAI